MNKLYNILCVVAALFASCTTDIDLKLDGTTPMLVVDGSITTDTTTHTVFLQKTTDYFTNSPVSGVSGAKVTLNDGIHTITLAESSARKGLYQTPASYYGLAGRTYTLHISSIDVNGDGVNEEYEAKSVLNNVPELKNVHVNQSTIFGRQMWAIKGSFQDPPGEKNFYLMRNYVNGKCVSDTITEWGISFDEYYNGYYMNDETLSYLSSEKKDEIVKVGDVVTLELCGITEDYLYFINDVVNEYRGHNPMFGGQPSNIRTNIVQLSPQVTKSNTPRGFFAAYSITRKSTVYQGN